MPICTACGFESPDMARFCRQCGSSLPADTDFVEPATRNYGRQAPAATAGSTHLPPSIGDAVAGETARYQPPLQAVPPLYTPPDRVPVPARTSSLKSKRRYLKWGGFLLALLISGGVGAVINQESHSNRIYVSQEDRLRLERLRADDQLKLTLTDSAIEQQERAQRELQRGLEAIQRARDEAQRDADRGDWTPSDERPLNLREYEYEGATAGRYSRIPGKELLTQRTKDSFEMVSRFYQSKLGPPFVQINERNDKQVLFQSAGTPSITVFVRESRDRSRQVEITILRSPFRFSIAQPQPDKADSR